MSKTRASSSASSGHNSLILIIASAAVTLLLTFAVYFIGFRPKVDKSSTEKFVFKKITPGSQLQKADRNMLIGKWRTNDDHVFNHYEDGRLSWYFSNGDSSYGEWSLSNNILTHIYKQFYGAGSIYKYNLLDPGQLSFKIETIDSPYYSYSVSRME